ncbi:hypothetical protein [Streptomyces clavifer]|uniref:hypothetical protein n=1 Tax=Streptomyces clavifer TaxID=68188 RepID=UPI0036B86C77
MTFYVSPLIGALFITSVLIGIWVHRTSSPTPTAPGGHRNGDVAAAITAAAAAFAVLCLVFTTPDGTAQHQQPPAHQAPTPPSAH